MADSSNHKRSTPWLAAVVFVIAVVYPLSMGPWLWLYMNRYVSEEFFLATHDVAYAPVRWIIPQLGPVDAWFSDYVQWWMDR